MKKGCFIVVEGLEGSGKTTAMTTIKRCLAPVVPELVLTREPGGTRVGEVVRTLIKEQVPGEPLDARAELLLFYAARVQLRQQVIEPALQRGAWVLADRFEMSTFAYQGGGRHLDESMLRHLSHFCLEGLQPDLILFLDVPPKVGLERAQKRGQLDRIEQESLDFFKAVHAAYHRQLAHLPQAVVIDGTRSLAAVQHHIRTTIETLIRRHVDTQSIH